jgi:hypothetical protein
LANAVEHPEASGAAALSAAEDVDVTLAADLPAQDELADEPVARVGYVEGCRHGCLIGWAVNPDALERRAQVLVESNSGQKLLIFADHYRADVQAAGRGDGYAGFSAPLWCLQGATQVSCRWADTGEHLFGSPLELANDGRRPGEGVVGQEANPGWIIVIDSVDQEGRTAGGYYMDLADPCRRPLLTLEAGGRPVGTARACLFHPEAPGDRMHGFRFLLDAPLPVGPCAIRDGDNGLVLVIFEREPA